MMVVASEPANAESGSSSFCRKRTLSPNLLSVKTIAAAAANAPPEETPTSAGSARGLRNRPCMIAPDVASRPPTIAAAAMRGMRIDHSTSWSRAVMGLDRSVEMPSAAQPRERDSRRAHGERDRSREYQHDEQADDDERCCGPQRSGRA